MVYPGGKNGSGVYQKIINQMPPHRVYIEAFAGSAAVLRLKRPAVASIAIDADAGSAETLRNELHGVTVVCDDAISFLKNYAYQGDELVYSDPPYLGSTRSSKRPIYKHEMMSDEDHLELLAVLKNLCCMVMISGYWSELYERELQGWRSISFQSMTRGGFAATEWLWMNYPEPFELHDYSYLGENFRERERIKRKKDRWRLKLQSMPALERFAILSVLQDRQF
jgi:site-specific DNA-adenine methylase